GRATACPYNIAAKLIEGRALVDVPGTQPFLEKRLGHEMAAEARQHLSRQQHEKESGRGGGNRCRHPQRGESILPFGCGVGHGRNRRPTRPLSAAIEQSGLTVTELWPNRLSEDGIFTREPCRKQRASQSIG